MVVVEARPVLHAASATSHGWGWALYVVSGAERPCDVAALC